MAEQPTTTTSLIELFLSHMYKCCVEIVRHQWEISFGKSFFKSFLHNQAKIRNYHPFTSRTATTMENDNLEPLTPTRSPNTLYEELEELFPHGPNFLPLLPLNFLSPRTKYPDGKHDFHLEMRINNLSLDEDDLLNELSGRYSADENSIFSHDDSFLPEDVPDRSSTIDPLDERVSNVDNNQFETETKLSNIVTPDVYDFEAKSNTNADMEGSEKIKTKPPPEAFDETSDSDGRSSTPSLPPKAPDKDVPEANSSKTRKQRTKKEKSTKVSRSRKLRGRRSNKNRPSRKVKIPEEARVYVKKVEEEDILSERGGKSNGHKGNKVYLDHVDTLKPSYRKLETAKEKTAFIEEHVLKWAKQRNARWLTRDQGSKKWYIDHPKNAHTKAGQALRDDREKKAL